MTLIGMLDVRKDPGKVYKSLAYAAAAKAEGVELYYFTPGRVDLDRNRIRGLYVEKGGWSEREFRYPDVILNSNSSASSAKQAEVIARLKERIPFTSHSVGSKLHVYRTITRRGEMAEYLLPTVKLTIDELWSSLARYDGVVLKPDSGRKGQGIYFIDQEEDRFLVRWEESWQVYRRGELEELVSPLADSDAYVLQPYTASRTKSGHVFDFRLHVQKDGNGHWRIASVYPRIGAPGRLTSNLSSGGSTALLEPFLKQQYKEEFYNVKRYLEQFALRFAERMDIAYRQSFDELGFDVMLDERGRLRVYEVNWRPGSPPTFYLELDTAVTAIQYAVYVANRGGDRNGARSLQGDQHAAPLHRA